MQSGQVGPVNFPRLNTCSLLLSEDCIRNQDKVSKILSQFFIFFQEKNWETKQTWNDRTNFCTTNRALMHK